MSTTKQPLKFLWTATFADGHIIQQPEDDRYSKHDDTSEWNPSSFRDIIEYSETSPLVLFAILNEEHKVELELNSGTFTQNGLRYQIGPSGENKLIYFRDMNQENVDGEWQEPYVVNYNIGYEYKDEHGKVQKRIITIDG